MAEAADQGRRPGPFSWRPRSEAVDALIRAARQHELGLEFLRKGAQDAVAAVFQVHAFLVDAARERLAQPGGRA
jgi:hypothetical protein